MSFNQCHAKSCAINRKSFKANCTCGFTIKWQKEKIIQLRAQLAEANATLRTEPEQPPAGDYPDSEFIKVQRKAAQLAADAYEEDQE